MIVVAKCPLRISLLGGASDLDWFVQSHGYGCSLGFSLSMYSTVVLNSLEHNSRSGRLCYSSVETYSTPSEIVHPLIRAAFSTYSPETLLELASFGVASGGSGLGGSSSFLVALLGALRGLDLFQGTTSDICQVAASIEINDLQKPIGYQDHYLCAHPGISAFRYQQQAHINPIPLSHHQLVTIKNLCKSLYLVPTYIQRSADTVLSSIAAETSSQYHILQIRSLAEKFIYNTSEDQLVLAPLLNSLIRESWEIKKQMTGVLTPALDALYHRLNGNEVSWIRLLGAGSGGYFLISLSHTCDHVQYFQDRNISDYHKVSISETGLTTIII